MFDGIVLHEELNIYTQICILGSVALLPTSRLSCGVCKQHGGSNLETVSHLHL